MENKTKTKIYKKPLWFVWMPIVAVLLVIAIIADCVCSVYWSILAIAFSDTESATNSEMMEEATANSAKINAEILEEGAVLLKNDNVLPLDSVTKVNVYGIISANYYPNTTGSGSITSADSVTFKDALSKVNISVNESIWNLIASQKVETTSSSADAGASAVVEELSLDKYNTAMSWANAKSFSEYAIVTFGRIGSEGADFGRSSLELGTAELALLQKLHTEGFKVITLINSSSVIEVGPVQQYSDAILWIGGPGSAGMNGVARIISGEVSPSGRLVDTWMYEHETSSTYYTAQQYNYYDASGKSIGGYTNFNEGIYVGYKWYETADAEGYWNDVSNGFGSRYEGVVAYPFGYGLSYANFTEKITDVEQTDSEIIFTVQTTNVTSVSSKNVLELYVEKPYTNGGVEVSKVELVGFAKSNEIADDTFETTITVNIEDLSSYNASAANGAGAYVLAGGEYKFYLASNETGAHSWKTLTDADHCRSIPLAEVVYSGDNGRSGDAVTAQNQLGADGNVLASDDNNAGYSALSRANGFANAKQTVFTAGKKVTLSNTSAMYKALTEYTDYGAYKGEIWDNLATGQSAKYTLEDMYTYDAEGNLLYEAVLDEQTGELISKIITGNVDYDDERWDYLISQMTVSEMETLIGYAGWRTAAVASINKSFVTDVDGPVGLNSYIQSVAGVQNKCTSFNSEPVSAATWNVELIEELGKAIGMEANASGASGWYAPGANIHRTPFGGRNAEYFSEDAYISGKMCSVEAGGALSVGLYCYAKHFALNDIEANRTSMENCWVSEQAAREIYFRPFEMAIKDGNLIALMDSYMWINGEWIGSNYSVLTKIVREEWGFNGVIVTDNGTSQAWMSPSKTIYAGGDMFLTSTKKTLDSKIKNSDEGISAMKTASKHILYSIATAYLNRQEAAKMGTNNFVPIFIVANVVLYGAALACAGVYVTKFLLYKKHGGAGVDGAVEDFAGQNELTDGENNEEQT